MFRNLFNSQLQKAASDMARNFPALRYNVALSSGSSQSFLSFFKPYETAKTDEPVVEPEEQPGFYNVNDEDEFPEQEKEPSTGRTEVEKREDPPAVTNRVPPSQDPKGPLDEEVL